jgi:hypothetical protein
MVKNEFTSSLTGEGPISSLVLEFTLPPIVHKLFLEILKNIEILDQK